MVRTENFKLKLLLLTSLYLQNQRKKRHCKCCRRKKLGEYFMIVRSLERDPLKYYTFFKMSKQHFDYIYLKISKEIKPPISTLRKKRITAKEKLVITLSFLASGSSFTDLSKRYLLERTTIQKCIYQTIRAINQCLMPIALPKPAVTDWVHVANEFQTIWNFPNCLGATDTKRFNNFSLINSESSTVMMAIVDARYKFLDVNIEPWKFNSDSSIFQNSEFGKMWQNHPDKLKIPIDVNLPDTDKKVPYVLLGDEAFGLNSTFLTPYQGKNLSQIHQIFNYRLNRARRIVEVAIDMLTNRWKILTKTLVVKHQQTMNGIVLACVVLNNTVKADVDDLKRVQNTLNRRQMDLAPLYRVPVSDTQGCDVREAFANWCVTQGNLPFQYNMVK